MGLHAAPAIPEFDLSRQLSITMTESAARLLLRQRGRIPVRKLTVGERNPDGQAATLG